MEIYTIGHSNYPYNKLIEMIKKYNINCVVDIRETPYSKYNVQYNKEDFHKSLKKSGYIYIYMGKEFGAKRLNPASYTLEGYADFEKFFQALKEVRYDGVITFEDFSSAESPEEKIKNNICYIRTIAETVNHKKQD